MMVSRKGVELLFLLVLWMNTNKDGEPNSSTMNTKNEGLLIPLKTKNPELILNKHHSAEVSGNQSPDTTKARKSKTQLPKFDNDGESQLVSESKKNVIEWTDHGKMIVLFAANLFWANQMVNLAQVIESIGLEYKNDKLTLANVHKIYSVYFYKEDNADLAIKEWDKAIKLFRSWKSIQGTAQCYLLKAFLKLNSQTDTNKSKLKKIWYIYK